MSETLFLIFEIIGTVAFSVSGAITAIEKKMDIFGVAILGLTTAVGGGIARDLLLGITPPLTFRNPVYALTAVAVAIIVFFPAVRCLTGRWPGLYERLLLVMDSIGLGVFTVIGVQAAYGLQARHNFFLAVFVGVITGVGGGIARDVLAGNTPYVFIKHFYACASLAGALVCCLLWEYTTPLGAMLLGAGVTLALRLLAAHFRWSLPKAA